MALALGSKQIKGIIIVARACIMAPALEGRLASEFKLLSRHIMEEAFLCILITRGIIIIY